MKRIMIALGLMVVGVGLVLAQDIVLDTPVEVSQSIKAIKITRCVWDIDIATPTDSNDLDRIVVTATYRKYNTDDVDIGGGTYTVTKSQLTNICEIAGIGYESFMSNIVQLSAMSVGQALSGM